MRYAIYELTNPQSCCGEEREGGSRCMMSVLHQYAGVQKRQFILSSLPSITINFDR